MATPNFMANYFHCMPNFISDNIRVLRDKNSITQEQLAKQVNKKRTAISNWEKGLSAPDIDDIITIATYFDITIDALLTTNLSEHTSIESRTPLSDRKNFDQQDDGSVKLKEQDTDYSRIPRKTKSAGKALLKLQELHEQQLSLQNTINARTIDILNELLANK